MSSDLAKGVARSRLPLPPSLPLTIVNLCAFNLCAFNSTSNSIHLSPQARLASDAATVTPVQAGFAMADNESICTTCGNAGLPYPLPQTVMKREDTEQQAYEAEVERANDWIGLKLPLTREERNKVFCCKRNKVICIGSGCEDEDGDVGRQELIERFVKDVAHDEGRFLSLEDIKAAYVKAEFVFEVQRSFDESTHARYFVPSIVFKKKYVEVHPRDMFISNPIKGRNKHIFEFVKCRDEKHITKPYKPVSRRITILDKPLMIKGVGIYTECKGAWFVSELSNNWGMAWYASDEYFIPVPAEVTVGEVTSLW